jgi:molybdenum cofactor biosynthesis enzyme MoaA
MFVFTSVRDLELTEYFCSTILKARLRVAGKIWTCVPPPKCDPADVIDSTAWKVLRKEVIRDYGRTIITS